MVRECLPYVSQAILWVCDMADIFLVLEHLSKVKQKLHLRPKVLPRNPDRALMQTDTTILRKNVSIVKD